MMTTDEVAHCTLLGGYLVARPDQLSGDVS